MEYEDKPSLTRTLKNISETFFKLVGNFASMAKAEAELATRSMGLIFIFVIITGSLCTTTWACMLAVIFVLLRSTLHFGLFLSLTTLVLINISVLCLVWMYITHLKNNLFFKTTRKHLRATFSTSKVENSTDLTPPH